MPETEKAVIPLCRECGHSEQAHVASGCAGRCLCDTFHAPDPCIAPKGNLCTDTGCWDADRCLSYRVYPPEVTTPTAEARADSADETGGGK